VLFGAGRVVVFVVGASVKFSDGGFVEGSRSVYPVAGDDVLEELAEDAIVGDALGAIVGGAVVGDSVAHRPHDFLQFRSM